MAKVNVVIVDATGNKEQKVGLPDDIKCGIIMVKLVEKIKLPSVGPDGNPISYKFIHKVTGRQLLEAQTLAEAGIKDGDVLRLQPEITAGATCPNCGNENSNESAFCVQCGKAMSAEAGNSNPEAAIGVQSNPAIDAYNASIKNSASTKEKLEKIAGNLEKTTNKVSIFFPIIGLLNGILSIIFGIITFTMSVGYYESSSLYGGDAYTGIQNAAAQTANNVKYLAGICKFGIGALLIVFGIALICYFGLQIRNRNINKG